MDASFLETQPVIKKQSKVRFSKKGITGEVVLRFVVTKDGKVDKIDIVSFNDSDFIDAAYETYEYTKYTPGTVNGVAVATRLQVTLTFPAK